MLKKIKIAFDLDGVIIDKPPLIPKKLLERLFRGKSNNGLHYRFPKSKIEQKIRKLSHYYLFRPPIEKNIEFIRELSKDSRYEFYIISARYFFLKRETEKWLEKRKVRKLFKEVFINLKDKQPHIFKEEKLREIKAEIFVDDDGKLADYLVEKKITKVFCFGSDKKCRKANFIVNLNEILS